MKQSRETDSTAEALIRAGRRLFTGRGYDGASVRAITSEAGANLGAITYHFGSKRNLYGEVAARAMAPLAERIVAATAGPGAPLDRVEAVVRAYFDLFANEPEVARLILQDVIVGREPPEAVKRVMRRVVGAVCALVEEGQRGGTIRDGDARLMAASLISQPLILMTLGRVVLPVAAGLDPGAPELRGRVVDHALAFARRGLTRGEEDE